MLIKYKIKDLMYRITYELKQDDNAFFRGMRLLYST